MSRKSIFGQISLSVEHFGKKRPQAPHLKTFSVFFAYPFRPVSLPEVIKIIKVSAETTEIDRDLGRFREKKKLALKTREKR